MQTGLIFYKGKCLSGFGAVTGIKGANEDSFRRGNVVLTAENIGLSNVDNTADNEKSVKYATSAGSAGAVAWENVSGKPSTFPPSTHIHSYLSLSGGTMTGNISASGGGAFAINGNVYINTGGYADWLTNILNGKVSASTVSSLSVAYARDTAGVIAGSADVRVGMSADGANFRTYNKAGTAAVNGYTNLGSGSYRWKQLFATTATISTSDRNLKKDIHQLTDAHLEFFLKLQPVSFLFKDGESGRTHIGFIAQDVEGAMEQCGLTDLDFAGFCKDQKVEVYFEEDENGDKVEKERPILDENNNPEHIYSLRYEEFIALNTYAIQKLWNRVEAVEKENAEMKEQVKSIQQDIAELKKSRV